MADISIVMNLRLGIVIWYRIDMNLGYWYQYQYESLARYLYCYWYQGIGGTLEVPEDSIWCLTSFLKQ